MSQDKAGPSAPDVTAWDCWENDDGVVRLGTRRDDGLCIAGHEGDIFEFVALQAQTIETLTKERDEARAALAHVRQHASGWALEARAQKATVDGVGAVVGLPDYGPIVSAVRDMADNLAAAEQRAREAEGLLSQALVETIAARAADQGRR